MEAEIFGTNDPKNENEILSKVTDPDHKENLPVLINVPNEEKKVAPLMGSGISGQPTISKFKTLELKRTETLSKLDSLKQLYEQGYLTQTEFKVRINPPGFVNATLKERKAQLVDSLTGTKSVTNLENKGNGDRYVFRFF
jgi:hypothetical protein